MDPAVRLARDGFVMTETVSASIAGEAERLSADPEAAADLSARRPAARRSARSSGSPTWPGPSRRSVIARGWVLSRPRGARPSKTIRNARADSSRAATSARYTAKLRKPFRFHFQGVDVLTTAAPSSGPVLAEMALMVEIAGTGRFRAPGVESMHWLAEIEKRAFYDRNRWLGDPAFAGVRQSPFRDRPRLQSLVASINPRQRDARRRPSRRCPPRSRRRPTSRWSTARGWPCR